jgi:predicted O-methyltransferase YrrM
MRAIRRPRKWVARAHHNFQFTKDWTGIHAHLWLRLLGHFSWQPDIHGMEIGCFEGRSSLFFLKKVLQHPTSSLTCIDPRPRPAFCRNIRAVRHKVLLIKRRSQWALRESGFTPRSFQFIYIDGDHTPSCVLSDAVLSFPLLAPGGIMIFDDYRWAPGIAIDSFLEVFEPELQILHRGARSP